MNMNRIKNRNLFSKLVLASFSMILFYSTNAQEVTKAKTINDSINGEVHYQYYLANQDTIYNGKFEFNSTKKNQDTKQIVSYNYEGNYSDNQLSGNWVFSHKKLAPLSSFKEKDYKVIFSTSGEEFKIKANFKDGLADGNWQVIRQTFEASKPTDTIFTINANFQNAKMIGALQAKLNATTIQGDFTEEGVLDGDWKINHRINNEDFVEVRNYANGVFKAHYFLKDQQKYTIQHKGLDRDVDDGETWEYIDMNNDYFQILELTNIGFENNTTPFKEVKSVTNKTNRFLKNTLLSFSYFKDYKVWNSLQNKEAIEFGQFKVRKYPYTNIEKKQLKGIVKKAAEVEQILNNFFSNSKIEIGKLTYQSLNTYENVLHQYQEIIPQLKNLIHIIQKPAFEYVDRKLLFSEYKLKFSFNSTIEYTFQKEQILTEHNFPNLPDSEDLSIANFYALINQMHQDVSEIDTDVQRIIEDLSKQEELNEDEERLVAKKEKINKLFSNAKKDETFNEYHEAIAQDVIEFANQSFENYVKLPVSKKKDEIQPTLICFEKLISAYTELADIPRKLDRLDDVYTRTSFNPYLMVDMSERIKERIYKAFENYLFPAIMREVQQNINCSSFSESLNELEKTYNRMVELSDEDTSAIEKELRREKDANAIKKILFK